MANDPCPGCGHVHAAPFSAAFQALAARLDTITTPEERTAFLAELADLFANEADWSDETLPEELHTLVEDYLQLKAETAAASFRLGRYLLRFHGAYQRHVAGETAHTAKPTPPKGAQPN